jgi:metallo-beta-lactamase class B
MPMTTSSRTLAAALFALAAGGTTAMAQNQRATAFAHIDAAKKAAGYEVADLFDHTCARLMVGAALPFGRIYAPPNDRDPASFHTEPVKVFDNLYYVGEKMQHGGSPSAWAVTTSAGIILIDTMFENSMQDEIIGGFKKLGLDPANIKYIILTHGHSDHVGGAKYLQDTYKPRVILGGPDWDALDNPNFRGSKPAKDMPATDGQKVTLGDVTITIYLTPGHTAGTLTLLIPVKDNGTPHMAALWGGTGMQFSAEQYSQQAFRMRDVVTAAGADVILSTHPQLDKSDVKLPLVQKRKPGDPHPYVVGKDVVRNYFTVAGECGAAAALLPEEYQGYLGRGGGGGRGAAPGAAPGPGAAPADGSRGGPASGRGQ